MSMKPEPQIRGALAVLEEDRQALLDMPETSLTYRRMISVEARIDELKWVLGEDQA